MAEKIVRRGRPSQKFTTLEKFNFLRTLEETGRVPDGISPYLFFKHFPVAEGWVNVEYVKNPNGKYRTVVKYTLGNKGKSYINLQRANLVKKGLV